jgi:cytochrome c2
MVRFAIAALTLSLAATPALAADGANLFNIQCKMCHGGSTMGPPLAGVAGGKIAARSDFAYSPALKKHGGTWTDANLDAFLKSPTAFAPGGKMMISVGTEDGRKAIIGYLKTLK